MTEGSAPSGLSQRRGELVRWMGEHLRRSGGAGDEIAALPADAPLPLSFAQERLWFLQRLAPAGLAANLPAAVELRGELDVAALDRALDEVVRRHAVLRSRLPAVDGLPQLEIAGHLERPPLRPEVVPGEGEGRRQALAAALGELAATRFDLARGPLFVARLLAVARAVEPPEHVLALCVHHVVADGWSLEILLRELAALYAVLAVRGAAPRRPEALQAAAGLPPLPIQYPDFAAWQRQHLAGARLERELVYWRRRLSPPPPSVDLPADRVRPALPSYRGGTARRAVPAGLPAALARLGRERGATVPMVLLGGLAALLARLTGATDLALGVTVTQRRSAATRRLVGPFANTPVLRLDLAGDPCFVDLVAQVRDEAAAAFDHAELPFERLVAALDAERDPSRPPLFQVLFEPQVDLLGEMAAAGASAGGLRWRLLEVDRPGCPADLALVARERGGAGGALEVALDFNGDVFSRAGAGELLDAGLALLAGAAFAPERRLSRLPLAAGGAPRAVLGVAPRRAVARDHGLTARVEAVARRHPERIAVVGGDRALSYAELEGRSSAVAAALWRVGARSEAPVAVLGERCPGLVVALLGAWRAGACFVPVSPDAPAPRLAAQLADAGGAVGLCVGEVACSTLGPARRWIGVDRDGRLIAEPGAAQGPAGGRAAHPDQLAYLLSTSGSSGRPKGVGISRQALAHALTALTSEIDLGAEDRWLAVTPVSFDIAILELLGPLAAGARTVMASREEARDGACLAALLEREEVTVLQATPATWRLLLAAGWRGAPRLRALCGGEAWSWDLAADLLARCREVWNVYGPTETTIWSSARRLGAGDGAVWIGPPLAGLRFVVLDERLEPVPHGVPGELAIGGPAVARGYPGLPGQTAERFVPDPFGEPGDRLYRTGDRVRLRRGPEGARIAYLGRLDEQLKIRGFRIDPGEVEAALAQHPAVRRAVVGSWPPGGAGTRLAAWILPAGEAPAASTLAAFLRARLPEAWLPCAWAFVDAFPATAHGKLDRRALPPPVALADRLDPGAAPPRGAEEKAVAAHVAQLLGVDRVGIHDDFFVLGGHSLLAARLLARLARSEGVELSLQAFFAHPTVAAVAAEIAAVRARRAAAALPGEIPGESEEIEL